MIMKLFFRKDFITTDGITVDKVVEFLDALSFQVRKNTFVVLDNATVYLCCCLILVKYLNT